jgi:hypothetical protein
MRVGLEQVAPESIAITGFLQLVQVSKLPPYFRTAKEREQLVQSLE